MIPVSQYPCTIALDPSLAETGYAVLDTVTRKVLAIGTVRTSRSHDTQKRLITIATAISQLIIQYHPIDLAIELPFVGQNRATALTLGAVRGMFLYLAAIHNLAVCEYTTSQIKTAVTGNPTAGKYQVQQMINRLSGLVTYNNNESDAVAVGFTHLSHAKFKKLIPTQARPKRIPRLARTNMPPHGSN